MSKRTIALIVGLCIIAVILLILALWRTNTASKQTVAQPTPTPYAQSTLSFTPSLLTIPSGTINEQTVHVMLSTGANDVTGVQLELSYDPKVLTNVAITSGSMFQNPNVIFKRIDPQSGTISYVYGITPAQKSQKGSGEVAILTFTVNPLAADQNGQKITQTAIRLLPKTEVASRGMDFSVLTKTSLANSVQVNLGSAAAITSTTFSPSVSSHSGY